MEPRENQVLGPIVGARLEAVVGGKSWAKDKAAGISGRLLEWWARGSGELNFRGFDQGEDLARE